MSQQEILDILEEENKWMTQKEINEVGSLGQASTSTCIRKLVADGDVFVKFTKGTRNPKKKIYRTKKPWTEK